MESLGNHQTSSVLVSEAFHRLIWHPNTLNGSFEPIFESSMMVAETFHRLIWHPNTSDDTCDAISDQI